MAEITPAAIHKIVMEEATRAAQRGALATVGEIQRLVPVKTGTARRSIAASRVSVGGDNTLRVEVGSNVAYVRYLDEGTGIYGPRHEKITPKARQALAFIAKNAKGEGKPFTLAGRARNTASAAEATSGLVVVRSVKGVPPMRFLLRGIEAARDARMRAINEAGPRISARLKALASA